MLNMGFFSSLGSSALGGLFGSVNSFNRSTYRSGWGNAIDPLGGLFGKLLIDDDSYQDERSLAMASALSAMQYDYAIRGMKEGPSAAKEGLIAAGYNPMLALGGAMAPASVSVGNQSPKESPSGSSIDINSARLAEEQLKIQRKNSDVQNAALTAQSAADVALKTSEAEKIRKEADSINPQVEKENRKYGNGVMGEGMRFIRTLKEGLGFSDSPLEARVGDYFPSPSSARQVKVISDEQNREEKRRGDAVRNRRKHH